MEPKGNGWNYFTLIKIAINKAAHVFQDTKVQEDIMFMHHSNFEILVIGSRLVTMRNGMSTSSIMKTRYVGKTLADRQKETCQSQQVSPFLHPWGQEVELYEYGD